jgi:hypothetical protein
LVQYLAGTLLFPTDSPEVIPMRVFPSNSIKQAAAATNDRPGRAGRGSPARAGGGQPIDEALLRPAGFIGLLGIAMIHFVDLFKTWKERPLIGAAFLALVTACLLAAGELVRNPRRGWQAAGILGALALLGYIVSRTWGLPTSRGDIGNWAEPLGLAALFVEGLVVAMSVWATAALRERAGAGVAQA